MNFTNIYCKFMTQIEKIIWVQQGVIACIIINQLTLRKWLSLDCLWENVSYEWETVAVSLPNRFPLI